MIERWHYEHPLHYQLGEMVAVYAEGEIPTSSDGGMHNSSIRLPLLPASIFYRIPWLQ